VTFCYVITLIYLRKFLCWKNGVLHPDLFCAFHQGAPGHDTEHCHPLKEEVQKLIENNVWSFDDPDLKVLNQQQHPASHSLAAAVRNSGYQSQSQQGQQQYMSAHLVNMMPIINVVRNPGYQPQSQQYQQRPRQQALQQFIPQNQAQKAPQYDQIPLKYEDLLPVLLREHCVQTRPPPRVPKKLPARWRPDLFCAFHQGAQGHDVEHYFSLKIEVQNFIDANILSFEVSTPIVQANQWA